LNHLSKLQMQIYLTPTCSGDRFLYEVSDRTGIPIVPASIPVFIGGAILANAKLFVTGRYHPSILAAFGGTPSIFLDADCHKSSSLLKLLGYPPEDATFSATPMEEECEEILRKAYYYLSNYVSTKKRIIENVENRYKETKEYIEVIKSIAKN
jgi:polysaccharide pyruvyl transferase WcaK-like protein